MYDFDDVRSASKAEQVRAWSVEQAIDIFRSADTFAEDVLVLAGKIEDYILNGAEKSNG